MQQLAEILVIDDTWHCPPWKAIQMWLITAIFVIAQFFLQLSIGVIAMRLRKDLSLSAFELSIIASTYYIIYVIFQIPAGLLIDRFGCRLILTIGAIVCCLSCALFATTRVFWLIIISRMLMGGSMSFSFIASLHIAAKWFPLKYLAFITGLAESVAMFGAIAGNLILAKLLLHFTWRHCYISFAGFMFFLAVFCWLFLRDGPPSVITKQINAKLSLFRLVTNLWSLLKVKNLWFFGLYTGICYTAITVYTALWEIPFLLKAYNLDLWMATFITAFGYLGIGIGSPLFLGKFNTTVLQKRLMIIAPLILCGSIIVLTYCSWHNLYTISLLNFLLGLGTSVSIFSYAIAPELAPTGAKNTSIGIINTLALSTAPIFQALIGGILDLQIMREVSPLMNYYVALSVLPICMLLATFLPMVIKFEHLKK